MDYKVAYLEDQGAESFIKSLATYGIEVVHIEPEKDFGATIERINAVGANLIVMDFRLVEGGTSVFNAPPFAQYYRSLVTENPEKSIPIVLYSNDEKIKKFYFNDFTSQDLFDYTIEKEKFFVGLERYSNIIKSLINSYSLVRTLQNDNPASLEELVSVPRQVKQAVDPRVFEQLAGSKYLHDTYMASNFILNQIVRPIGILIGEDVISARLGISKSSSSWSDLLSQLEEFKYLGLFSDSYERWWAEGIEYWWKNTVKSTTRLRRLSSAERLASLREKFTSFQLDEVEGDHRSVAKRYWTICKLTSIPVDPSDAFEVQTELSSSPWLEAPYYTFEAVRDNSLNQDLLPSEKIRYRSKAQGE